MHTLGANREKEAEQPCVLKVQTKVIKMCSVGIPPGGHLKNYNNIIMKIFLTPLKPLVYYVTSKYSITSKK